MQTLSNVQKGLQAGCIGLWFETVSIQGFEGSCEIVTIRNVQSWQHGFPLIRGALQSLEVGWAAPAGEAELESDAQFRCP